MQKIILVFTIFLVQIFFAQSVFAGNIQLVNSLSLLEGRAPTSKYSKDVFNSAIEYPLTAKQSVGGTLQASYNDFKRSDAGSAYALNSIEIFHRYKIFSYEKLGITVGNLYKFPGIYHENNALGLGPQQADYELRFFFAYNMQDRMTNQVIRGSNSYFVRPEVAYRHRFGNPFDELRFTFTGGLKIDPKFLLLFQDNIIWNVASKANITTSSYYNPTFSKDANNTVTLSLIYRYNNEIALQAGYIKRVHGNAALHDSQGVIFGLWTSF